MSRLPLQSNQNEVTVKPCSCMPSTTNKKFKQKYVIGSDVKKFPFRFIKLLILFFSLFLAGIAYLLYLHVIFPKLVPFHLFHTLYTSFDL